MSHLHSFTDDHAGGIANGPPASSDTVGHLDNGAATWESFSWISRPVFVVLGTAAAECRFVWYAAYNGTSMQR